MGSCAVAGSAYAGAMSTRLLLGLSLVTGLMILVAFAAQVILWQ